MDDDDVFDVHDPPSFPYQGLMYPHLRRIHDRIYFGSWRGSPGPTDLQEVYRQLGSFLNALEQELCEDSPPRAKEYLARARETHRQADPERTVDSTVLLAVNNTLSYGHRVLDILLQAKGESIHVSRDFAQYYDSAQVEDE